MGPPGPPGTEFIYSQGLPQTVWTINHNMGFFPSVTIVSSAGGMVEGDITYIDSNNLTVSFAVAFSGTAYLV